MKEGLINGQRYFERLVLYILLFESEFTETVLRFVFFVATSLGHKT